jgi:hypothetical protein
MRIISDRDFAPINLILPPYLWHLTPAPTPQQDEARQKEDNLEQYTVRLSVNKQLHELVSR